MRFNVLFFSLILACLYLTLAQGSYEDCCLKYVKQMDIRRQKLVVKYRWQETDGGCNIRAVVFTMKKGRMLCGNPGLKWVQDLMQKIDTKKPVKKQRQRQHRPRG